MTRFIVASAIALGTLLNEAAVFWAIGDMHYWSQTPFLPVSLRLWVILVPFAGLMGVIAASRSENPMPRELKTVLGLLLAVAIPPLVYGLLFLLPFAEPAIILLACFLVLSQVWLFVRTTGSWTNCPIAFGICTMIAFAAGSSAGLFHIMVMSLSDP